MMIRYAGGLAKGCTAGFKTFDGTPIFDPCYSPRAERTLCDLPGTVTLWDKAHDQLLAIARLGPNWDGDGAAPIRGDIIRSASLLLRISKLRGDAPPNDVYPTADGNIVVEWQSPDDVITRIEVDGLDQGEKMTSFPNAPSQFVRVQWRIHSAKELTYGKFGDNKNQGYLVRRPRLVKQASGRRHYAAETRFSLAA